MAKVKICGLKQAKGVAAALEAGAEYLGFVFAPNSPRQVTPEAAAALAEPARGRARIVAVLVNPGNKLLGRVVAQLKPDLLQLHGKESPERVRAIWKRFHLPVIKAVGIAGPRDLEAAERYARTAACYLLDAKPPRGAAREGGLGQAFDWSLPGNAALSKPWFLAGGLTPENVSQAIAQSGAAMVDVSSGVECAPGVKDAHKIAAFVAAAKAEGAGEHED